MTMKKSRQNYGIWARGAIDMLINKLDLPYPKETVESYGGEYTQEEIDIAEAIFAWWISGKGYTQWYAENISQQKMDFSE